MHEHVFLAEIRVYMHDTNMFCRRVPRLRTQQTTNNTQQSGFHVVEIRAAVGGRGGFHVVEL